jgi:hypothetical protein
VEEVSGGGGKWGPHLRKRRGEKWDTTPPKVSNYMSSSSSSSSVMLLSTKLDKWLTICHLLLSLTQRVKKIIKVSSSSSTCVLPLLSLSLSLFAFVLGRKSHGSNKHSPQPTQ